MKIENELLKEYEFIFFDIRENVIAFLAKRSYGDIYINGFYARAYCISLPVGGLPYIDSKKDMPTLEWGEPVSLDFVKEMVGKGLMSNDAVDIYIALAL